MRSTIIFAITTLCTTAVMAMPNQKEGLPVFPLMPRCENPAARHHCPGGGVLTPSDCVNSCKCRNGGMLLCEYPISGCDEGTVQLFCERMGDADPYCGCC